jgi:Spy/CpxP family protein refolding chaperone
MPAIVAMLALVGLAAPGLAQQGPPQGRGMPSVDERLAQMTEQLQLTDEQVTKVRPILEKQDRQRQELFETHGGDRETMRAEMRKLIEEGDKELASVLTEQQMTKHVEQRQQRVRQGPPGGRPGGPPNR